MDRYLMTHSLLSSWLYAIKENPFEDATSEKDPMGEFMLTLRREPTPTNEAMMKGIAFEDLVTAIVNGEHDTQNNWYNAAAKVAGIVGGGILQFRARKEIQVGGLTLVLYGRLDALKAGGVYDIKFSSRYERGKYFDSTQHPVYLELVPEAQHFTYLVSNGSEVWTEQYRREETPSIYPIISDFLDWLSVQGLLDLYREKWIAK